MIGVIFVSFLYSQIDSLIDTNRVDTTTFAPYKLTDFRMPESGAMTFSVALDACMQGYSYSYSTIPYFDSIYIRRGLQNSISAVEGDFLFYREKEKIVYSFKNKLSFNYQQTAFSQDEYWDDYFFPIASYIKKSGSFSVFMNPSGGVACYPFGDIFFLGFNSGVATSAVLGNGIDSSMTEISKSKNYGYYESFFFSPRIGLGRIRSLQYPSNALEIANILTEELGLVKDPQLIEDIAELLAKRWEYPLKYRHYKWEFFEDIEELFIKYGISKSDMDIRTWMQVIDASVAWSDRPYGIRVYLEPRFYQSYGVANSTVTLLVQPWYNRSQYVERSSLAFNFQSIYLEFGYPLSNNSQLEGSLIFSALPAFVYDYRHFLVIEPPYSTIDTTLIEEKTEVSGFSLSYNLSYSQFVWDFFGVSPYIWGIYEQAPYYSGFGYETRKELSNDLFLGGKIFLADNLTFSIWGGFKIDLRRDGTSPIIFDVNPAANINLDYRIF